MLSTCGPVSKVPFSLQGGMCGFLLPPEGDPCPTVVPTPFGTLGDDIGANATCSAFYANPLHQKHISRPLEGQGFEVSSPALCHMWQSRSCRAPSLIYRDVFHAVFFCDMAELDLVLV